MSENLTLAHFPRRAPGPKWPRQVVDRAGSCHPPELAKILIYFTANTLSRFSWRHDRTNSRHLPPSGPPAKGRVKSTPAGFDGVDQLSE